MKRIPMRNQGFFVLGLLLALLIVAGIAFSQPKATADLGRAVNWPGRWSLTVTPNKSGRHVLYLLDTATGELFCQEPGDNWENVSPEKLLK